MALKYSGIGITGRIHGSLPRHLPVPFLGPNENTRSRGGRCSRPGIAHFGVKLVRKQSDSCQPILTISLDMSGRIWTLSLDLTSTSMNLLAHVDPRLLGSMPKKVAQVVCFASSFAVSSLHLLRFCFEVHAVVQQLFGRTNELPGNQFEGRWGELIPTFPWDRLKGLRVHRLFHPPSRRSTFARMKPIVRRIASVGIVHHNWSIALEQQCKPSIIEQKLYYLQYVTVACVKFAKYVSA